MLVPLCLLAIGGECRVLPPANDNRPSGPKADTAISNAPGAAR